MRVPALVRRRQGLCLAVAGLLAATLAVLAGGQATVGSTTPPTYWFGLISATGYEPGRPWLFGFLLFIGIAVLVLLWLLTIRLNNRGALTTRGVWGVAVLWSAPFVLGPPLISKDVYAYAAHGLMLGNGIDVYATGVSALAQVDTSAAQHALAAVDPAWRTSPSPYGPLASAIERMSAALGGGPVGTVLVLRALAVVCVVAIGLFAADLAGAHRRAGGLVLTLLNPLVLVQAVSASHLEAPMCALLLAGLVAAKRHRWVIAILLICAAGAIKAPGLAALPALIVVHATGETRRSVIARTTAVDVGAAAAFFAALSLLVPNGFGWLPNLSTPGSHTTIFAPSTLIGDLLRPLITSSSTTAGRAVALFAAALIVIFLTATAADRPLEVSVGYGLLAVAFLAPVIYPWYVLWGALGLLATAPTARRNWLVALCGVESVAAITGAPTPVTATFDAVAVAVALGLLYVPWLRNRRKTSLAAVQHPVPRTG